MPTITLIRNIITSVSLVLLFVLLCLYLWGPKLLQQTEPPVPEINFSTEVFRLSGITSAVTADSFTLTMPASGFPPDFKTTLLSRNVIINENTVIKAQQRRTDLDVYGQEMQRYQEFLARNGVGMQAERASSTTPNTTPLQTSTSSATTTESLLQYAPQLYIFATTSASALIEGASVVVVADENIYTLPEITATEILILGQN